MIRDFFYPIDQTFAGFTIAEFLKHKGYSRHIIIAVRNRGAIKVDGAPAITPQILNAGETLSIRLEETVSSPKIVPTPMPLCIVYEDQDLMVINKPADLPVHPSQGNFEHTLANGIAHCFAARGESFIYRVINRLDRDTTGLLILAKHQLSAGILSKMVAGRSIKREYLAVVTGDPGAAGRIEAPIARADDSTVLRCVDETRGDYSLTLFKRLLYHEPTDCSLIQLNLQTGRTHQIRVHMKHIGHPIPGDFLYHPDYRHIQRQALHSHKLAFTHPVTGRPMAFCAPLPADMNWVFT